MAKVLILEPDPDLRALAVESLAEIGHAAVLPGEADAGSAVDLVLLACASGRGASRLSVGARWAALPLVCVADEPVAPERRCPRSAAYLVRPYSLETLSKTVERALTPPVVG